MTRRSRSRDPWINLAVTVAPLILIFGIVVFSMTEGWATPTESSALGALATILLALCYGSLTPENLWKSFLGTLSISGSLLFIIVGATTFAQLLSFSGATAGLVALIEGAQLGPNVVMIGMLTILILLGFFIDQTSIMMITLPFYMPLLRTMGVDLVWFGILYLLCMQIGLLTPPFGLLLFVLKGVAPPHITIGTIYRAAIPYVWLTILMMVLIFMFPRSSRHSCRTDSKAALAMKAPEFLYRRPDSLDEALALLADNAGRGAGAGRRPEPDADAQHAVVVAGHAGRYQPHRGSARDRGLQRDDSHRRAGAPLRGAGIGLIAEKVPLLARP